MATFSRTTFDAAAYLAFRPSYPKWVFDKVFAYQRTRTPTPSSNTLAIDLGCGPGISTLMLLPHFDKVIGLEPSSKMVSAAVGPDSPSLPSALRPDPSAGRQNKLGQLEYKQGSAEDLSWLADNSVDLVTAGQAAHWFDYPRVWNSLSRVVKPGGSVCFWGYPDFFIPDYPKTRSLIYEFALNPNAKTDSIASYWEQPGRSIVNNALGPVPFPTDPELASKLSSQQRELWDASSAFRRIYSTEGLPSEHFAAAWPSTPANAQPSYIAELDQDGTMDKQVTWSQLASYLRTWSACHAFLEQHPDDKAQSGDGKRDIVDRFVDRLKEQVFAADGNRDREKVSLRWPVGFVMIQKKAA